MNQDDERLALAFRALAHPARLAILRALSVRGMCVCGEIVDSLPLAQSTVSQHLKILKEAGLIRGTISGPRSCYCLDAEAIASVSQDLAMLMAALTPACCTADAQGSGLLTAAPTP
jgi:ArsR family transcriptional regulator